MKFLSKAIFSLSFTLGACSVWQSEGRKFLEKQAFEYTGAQAYLVNCSSQAETAGLNPLTALPEAFVYSLDSENTIRVVPATEKPFACDYRFTNSQELHAQIPGAVENTWQHYRNPAPP